MISIKIDDTLFAHDFYSTAFQKSKYITWNRTPMNTNDELVVYTDSSLQRVNNNIKHNIGWLLESPVITEYSHNWIKKNYNDFELILTNNKDLLDLNEKFKFLATGGCWIKPEDQKIYEKSKLLSIIASSKNWTSGHILRQSILNSKPRGLDIYGRGHAEIDYKLKGLKDYMFSIAIENTKKDYYFTEKLIDCFTTGTIPIYCGCPSINNFFNEDGIITFDTIEELNEILKNLAPDQYFSKLEAIKDNYEKSKMYIIAEDYMYENYLKSYVEYI